jgi:hypothetical protein
MYWAYILNSFNNTRDHWGWIKDVVAIGLPFPPVSGSDPVQEAGSIQHITCSKDK